MSRPPQVQLSPPPPRVHAAHVEAAPAVVENKPQPIVARTAPPAVGGLGAGDAPLTNASWAKVVDAATTRRIKILVESVQLSEISDEHAVVTAEADMAAAVQGAAPEIEEILRRVFGKPLRLKVAGGADENRAKINAITTPLAAASATSAMPTLAEHPLVKEAMELFNARIVGVQRRQVPPAGGTTS